MNLALIALTCVLALGEISVSAQDNPAAKPAVSPKEADSKNSVKPGLRKATEAMVANITTALKAFEDVNRPPDDKIKDFDNMISQIKGANSLVAEGGELYKEIKIAINRQLAKQKTWERKARDPDTKAKYRADYLVLAKKQGANAKRIANMLVIIIQINQELEAKLISIEKDREYYIDMIDAEQTKKAGEVLDAVALSMSEVIIEINKLQSPEMQGLYNKPPEVDQK